MPPASPVNDVSGETVSHKNPQGDAIFIEFEPNYRNNETSKTEKGKKDSLDIDDPWAIQELASFGKPWAELTDGEKVKRVFIGIGKGLAVLALLYFFVCSLDLLSLGFRLVGGRTTGEIFQQSDILQNPIVGVMIGILTTVLVQSSSTSTSIIVSMVSSGFLGVRQAIPIIMGANIGTSITNTIVSLTQVGDRNQFRRAFAGATVHDMFNWLTVISLLIIEVTTGYLYHLTTAIMDGLVGETGSGGGEIQLLGAITKPFVDLIVQLDKKVLECWSKPNCNGSDDASLQKQKCGSGECDYLFKSFDLNDAAAGGIILACSLLVLCTCLILIVKVLQSVLRGQIAFVIKKTLNSKIPYVPWLTGYIAILVGAVMTFLVQSSSVFTSALTPLVGLGVISVERVYPLTLGSNIGTTTTALLASMAVEGDTFRNSMQIALCHLFFNVTGILIFYPIPFMRFPIPMAKFLGDTTAKYRWFAVIYMILMFIVAPLITMGLSFAGMPYVVAFAVIICVIFLFVVTVNMIRDKKPSLLPAKLQSWKWLPEPMRSLAPYDRIFTNWACCKKLKNKGADAEEQDNGGFEDDDSHVRDRPSEQTKGNLNMVAIENGRNNGGIVNTAYVE